MGGGNRSRYDSTRYKKSCKKHRHLDADGDLEWITVNGTHIPLKDGKAVGGPPEIKGKTFSKAKSQTSNANSKAISNKTNQFPISTPEELDNEYLRIASKPEKERTNEEQKNLKLLKDEFEKRIKDHGSYNSGGHISEHDAVSEAAKHAKLLQKYADAKKVVDSEKNRSHKSNRFWDAQNELKELDKQLETTRQYIKPKQEVLTTGAKIDKILRETNSASDKLINTGALTPKQRQTVKDNINQVLRKAEDLPVRTQLSRVEKIKNIIEGTNAAIVEMEKAGPLKTELYSAIIDNMNHAILAVPDDD